MKRSGQNQSLRSRFRRLSIRWSLIGLVLTILVIVPTGFFVIRHTSNRQVEVMATALGRAFRPMILQDQARDAQLQMDDVAKLKAGESVTILDKNFKPVYLEKLGDEAPAHCKVAGVPCWLSGGTLISIAAPIYFDDDTKHELYGYLSLNLKPTVDWAEVLIILFGGGLIFWLQVRGIYSSLKKESARIERVLSHWKARIDNPKLPEPTEDDRRLFAEFLPLNQSIGTLHSRITALESVAAATAATKAKTDIVRGIGHDLKTPLSQLSKFFAVFVSNTKTKNFVNDKEVERIESTMRRMGSLIRQVTNLGRKSEIPSDTNLTLWLTAYCNELRTDPEVVKSGIDISFENPEKHDLFSSIHEVDLFRLVDNVSRNAIEAFPENPVRKNKITISLKSSENRSLLSISDNGSGIPLGIQHKIFDLDFTTKKARGTGLGLGIVNKICTDLNLQLNFKSSESTGTTFIIEFPSILKKFSESVLRGEVSV